MRGAVQCYVAAEHVYTTKAYKLHLGASISSASIPDESKNCSALALEGLYAPHKLYILQTIYCCNCLTLLSISRTCQHSRTNVANILQAAVAVNLKL